VLIAIVKKRLKLPHSFYEFLQILSLTIFETIPMNQLLPTASTGEAPKILSIQGALLCKRWETTGAMSPIGCNDGGQNPTTAAARSSVTP
jgi:hypothetical protein